MTLVIGGMPFWPVQAIMCAVIAIALFLLGRYLNQGRRYGTSGGLDAFTFIGGLLILGLVKAVAMQGRAFDWTLALAGVAAVLVGLMLHRTTRRNA